MTMKCGYCQSSGWMQSTDDGNAKCTYERTFTPSVSRDGWCDIAPVGVVVVAQISIKLNFKFSWKLFDYWHYSLLLCFIGFSIPMMTRTSVIHDTVRSSADAHLLHVFRLNMAAFFARMITVWGTSFSNTQSGTHAAPAGRFVDRTKRRN